MPDSPQCTFAMLKPACSIIASSNHEKVECSSRTWSASSPRVHRTSADEAPPRIQAWIASEVWAR